MEALYKNKVWLSRKYLSSNSYIAAREAKCCPSTIIRWLKYFNIRVRGYSEARRLQSNHVDLRGRVLEFLNGLLLGDGHLNQHKWSSAYCESSKSKGYLKCLSEELENFGIEQCGRIKRQEKDMHFPNNKICHTIAFHYNSQCYIELKDLWRKWYRPATEEERKVWPWRKFVKIIPLDLELTPLTCLYWFLGDGHLDIALNGKAFGITLCSQCFEVTEVDFLMALLGSLGFKISRNADNKIRIWTRSAQGFLSFIGPCPEKINDLYGYKWRSNGSAWKTPQSRS